MIKRGRTDETRLRESMLASLPQLRRFARSLTGNRHDGDDLLQMTVERVLRLGVPNDVDVLRWMFKVCKNLWIDEHRARQVRARAVVGGKIEYETTVNGEAVATTELELAEVDRAMAELPAEQRAVVALVAVEGLSYREAAEVLGTPIGTVMSRLARARAALADHFAGDGRRKEES